LKRILLCCLIGAILVPGIPAQDKPDALQMYLDGDFEGAIEVCLAELEALPRNMDSYVVMGWCLLELGRYEEALARSEDALAIAPYDPRIIEIAAEARFYLGKNAEALRGFEQYVFLTGAAGGRIAQVYYLMGEIFIRLGQYNNADIAFSTALHHNEKIALWWARLGYAREMGGLYEWALEAYENALRLNPILEQAANGLEAVKKKMGAE
jgi:tetratricopeptide (TPR) repeat protein